MIILESLVQCATKNSLLTMISWYVQNEGPLIIGNVIKVWDTVSILINMEPTKHGNPRKNSKRNPTRKTGKVPRRTTSGSNRVHAAALKIIKTPFFVTNAVSPYLPMKPGQEDSHFQVLAHLASPLWVGCLLWRLTPWAE